MIPDGLTDLGWESIEKILFFLAKLYKMYTPIGHLFSWRCIDVAFYLFWVDDHLFLLFHFCLINSIFFTFYSIGTIGPYTLPV